MMNGITQNALTLLLVVCCFASAAFPQQAADPVDKWAPRYNELISTFDKIFR